MRRLALLLPLGLLACQQDPYQLVSFTDDAKVSGDGGWIDMQNPGDVGPTDARPGDGAAVDLGPDLSYDACIALPEACNNVDDNCNGQIDEGLDKLGDPRFCEACKGCMWLTQLHAYPECVAGKCAIKDCMAGYVDVDKEITNGCEYQCEPTGTEICDGVDNDCNGKACQGDGDCAAPGTCGPDGHCVDEGVTLLQQICKTQAGTPCASATAKCMGADGWVCQYGADVELQPCQTDADCGTGFKCSGGVCPGIVAVDEARCDGKDGDCDGVADDPWANPALPSAVGKSCDLDPTATGICKPQGEWACNTAQDGVFCKQLKAGASPTDELCNGLDDDCDGKVDEEQDDAAGKGVTDDMVHVKRTVGSKSYDFYIYAYEASRPDASASATGELAGRSCSKKGVLPWGSVTHAEAQAACAASGKRLCTANEWVVACQGPAPATLYPYGGSYQPQSCNGVDAAKGGPLPTGSLAACEGGDSGLFDMSGNLREWTSEQRGTTSGTPKKKIFVVRGGAYHTPQLGLTCSFDDSQAVEDVVLPANGFRCCSNSAP